MAGRTRDVDNETRSRLRNMSFILHIPSRKADRRGKIANCEVNPGAISAEEASPATRDRVWREQSSRASIRDALGGVEFERHHHKADSLAETRTSDL